MFVGFDITNANERTFANNTCSRTRCPAGSSTPNEQNERFANTRVREHTRTLPNTIHVTSLAQLSTASEASSSSPGLTTPMLERLVTGTVLRTSSGFLSTADPRPPASPTSVATVAPRPPSAVDCKWTVLEIHRLVGVLLQNGDLCDRCWSRADQPRARQPSHRPRHARHLHLHLGARTRSALAQWPARVRLFVEN